jgi:Ser/Thr protein kinase RdoA (MazF antagonist)
MVHVAGRDASLPVPRHLPGKSGDFVEAASLPCGTPTTLRLMTFFDGTPQYQTRRTMAQRVDVAKKLARLDRALKTFEHAKIDHDLLWDITRAARLRFMVEAIADPDERSLATYYLDAFEADAAGLLGSLRWQFIHNDLNPHNVLVKPTEPDVVTGLIDFGDMMFAPTINEIAVAASYEDFFSEGWLDGVCAFVAAYAQDFPLTRDELSILACLIATRHVLTLAITEWRASLYPENRAYILRNRATAVTALRRFRDLGDGRVTSALLAACGA